VPRHSRTYWPARKVVGIYIGWRGLSFDAGEIAEDLTFWTRMATAHRVAERAVREVLSRAKALRDAVDAASWPGHQDHRNTRLVTIGHSFGGLIVYTALSQYFIDRAVQTETAPFARSLMPERARARG
jgi:dienelactone hydrolase